MPPEQRVIPRFAAEPPHEALPYGRWAQRLTAEFLGACLGLGDGEDLGEPGELVFYPDRTWHGRAYVPVSTITSREHELFGYVRFIPAGEQEEPSELYAYADFTEETAARNPEWKLDLCEEAIGSWRGPTGEVAAMTLVWGRPLLGGGRMATAELQGVTVDQCELIEQRFTLIAPDDYRGDLLEVALYGGRGQELARESLYTGDDEDEDEDEEGTDEGESETAGEEDEQGTVEDENKTAGEEGR
jgi:hypothetical protein